MQNDERTKVEEMAKRFGVSAELVETKLKLIEELKDAGFIAGSR